MDELELKDAKVRNLEHKIIQYEDEIAELKTMVFYEPIAHDEWTEKLKKSDQYPLKLQDLTSKRTENTSNIELFGLGEYYSSIMNLTPIEQEVLDLSKPFKLYSNHIRLSTFEKLNLLERETVGLYQKKVVKM